MTEFDCSTSSCYPRVLVGSTRQGAAHIHSSKLALAASVISGKTESTGDDYLEELAKYAAQSNMRKIAQSLANSSLASHGWVIAHFIAEGPSIILAARLTLAIPDI